MKAMRRDSRFNMLNLKNKIYNPLKKSILSIRAFLLAAMSIKIAVRLKLFRVIFAKLWKGTLVVTLYPMHLASAIELIISLVIFLLVLREIHFPQRIFRLPDQLKSNRAKKYGTIHQLFLLFTGLNAIVSYVALFYMQGPFLFFAQTGVVLIVSPFLFGERINRLLNSFPHLRNTYLNRLFQLKADQTVVSQEIDYLTGPSRAGHIILNILLGYTLGILAFLLGLFFVPVFYYTPIFIVFIVLYSLNLIIQNMRAHGRTMQKELILKWADGIDQFDNRTWLGPLYQGFTVGNIVLFVGFIVLFLINGYRIYHIFQMKFAFSVIIHALFLIATFLYFWWLYLTIGKLWEQSHKKILGFYGVLLYNLCVLILQSSTFPYVLQIIFLGVLLLVALILYKIIYQHKKLQPSLSFIWSSSLIVLWLPVIQKNLTDPDTLTVLIGCFIIIALHLADTLSRWIYPRKQKLTGWNILWTNGLFYLYLALIFAVPFCLIAWLQTKNINVSLFVFRGCAAFLTISCLVAIGLEFKKAKIRLVNVWTVSGTAALLLFVFTFFVNQAYLHQMGTFPHPLYLLPALVVLMVVFALLLFIDYLKKGKKFPQKLNQITQYFNSKPITQKQQSLLSNAVEFFVYGLLLYILLKLFLPLSKTSHVFLYILNGVAVAGLIGLSFTKQGKNSWVLIVPNIISILYVKNGTVGVIPLIWALISIWGIGLVYLGKASRVLWQRFTVCVDQLDFVSSIKEPYNSIKHCVFHEEQIKLWQGFIIVIVITLYVVTQKVDPAGLPQQFQEFIAGLKDVLTKADPVYIAFLLWIAFLGVDAVQFMTKAYRIPENVKIGKIKGFLNFNIELIVILFIMIFLLTIFIIPFAIVTISFGITILGKEFALLLGFFTFPRIIIPIYSWLIFFFIYLSPIKMKQLED